MHCVSPCTDSKPRTLTDMTDTHYDEYDALEDIAKFLEDIRKAAADAELLAKEFLVELEGEEEDGDE